MIDKLLLRAMSNPDMTNSFDIEDLLQLTVCYNNYEH